MKAAAFAAALGLAPIAQASAASAQGPAPTVEAAQSFLGKLASQQMMRLARSWPYVRYGRTDMTNCTSGCAYTYFRPVSVQRIQAGKCSTLFGHETYPGFQEYFSYQPTAAITGFSVPWDKVTKVQRAGRDVNLTARWPDGVEGATFQFDTEELATRAASAMEFLRKSCDALGGGAF